MRFTTSSTRPNESQRRMRPRSLTARESSCPLGQRSWKLTGRSCSLAYSALRMRASTRVPGVSTNQRRSAIMTASSTPRPSTSPANGQIALASPSASGPSTMRLQHLRDGEGDELRDERGDHARDDERQRGAGVLAQAEERAHRSDARG